MQGSIMRVAGEDALQQNIQETKDYVGRYKGHTIVDSLGNEMPKRSKVRFNNSAVTDDEEHDVTIVNPGGGTSVNNDADEFDATKTYAEGDYCVYEGVLYKFESPHMGEWDSDDVIAIKVMEELGALTSAEVQAIKDSFNLDLAPLPLVMTSGEVEEVKNAFILI